MTDHDLERRLRAWYRADGDDADSAPPQLRADLAAIGQDAESRRPPTGWKFPRLSRSAPLALGATALVAAILIGVALFLGQAPDVGPTGSPRPSSSASEEPSAIPSPALPLGGGLILVYQSDEGGACTFSSSPFEVYALDPGTGARTLLGTTCSPHGLAFQWAPDRVHVLMTDNFAGPALALDTSTAAGQNHTFICCNLPTDVWQGGSGTGHGWLLSPAGDRVAAIHTSVIQYPGQEGVTGISDGIVVANIDGSGQETLLLPAGADIVGGGLNWSPDQSAIVVAACLPCNHADRGQPPSVVNRMHLFVVPVDGSAVRDLFGVAPGTVWGAAWSPDASRFAAVRLECQAGEAIPYCDVERTTASLELVSATDGSEQVLVTGKQVGDPFAGMTAPIWSRDGAWIAFSTWSVTSAAANAFVIETDGSNLTALGRGSLVGWSPDGEWLLVARARADQAFSDLWIVRADGTEAQPIGAFAGAAW
jgi:Tol biopolymer transport system component